MESYRVHGLLTLDCWAFEDLYYNRVNEVYVMDGSPCANQHKNKIYTCFFCRVNSQSLDYNDFERITIF